MPSDAIPLETPHEGLKSTVDGILMEFRNGYWGHTCAEPQDISEPEIFALVREHLAKEGVKQWPEHLVMRVMEASPERGQIEVRRLDGNPMKNRLPMIWSCYIRSYRRKPSDDILQSIRHVTEGIMRELRGLSPHDEIQTVAEARRQADLALENQDSEP